MYEKLLEGVLDVKAHKSIGDYQGDEFMVVTVPWDTSGYDERVGWLVVGYGSCSGCDSYFACSTPEERLSLLSSIVDDVRWFDTFEALQDWLREYDYEANSWWGNEDEVRAFIHAITDAASIYDLP